MILDDFIIKTDIGYYCKYANFYIDPSAAVENSVVSHAHADHASPGSIKVYCTEPTQAFMVLRYKHKAAKEFNISEFNILFSIGEVLLTFIPAGHILGSAQILMTYKGIKYLYSGDIKWQEDNTVEATESVYADVLITETTFARPEFEHPNAKDEIDALLNLKSPIVIGAYVLGKAQRINSLINQYHPEIPVYIHFDVYPYHKIYDRLGKSNLKYELLQKKDIRNGRLGVYIVPPLTYQSYKIQYPYTFAFASGWDHLQNGQTLLKISDHMDWKELLHYIDLVQPKQIWAIHGDPKKIIEHFANTNTLVKVL
jgi:putative mRNA 3-end processing factor